MQSLSDRLKWAMERRGAKPADLAKACKVKQPSVSDWLSGKTKALKYESATRAAAYLEVNAAWLTEGRGPRLSLDPTAAHPLSLAAQEQPGGYTQSAWPFAHISPARWSSLPTLDRQRIETFVEATIQSWEARQQNQPNGTTG